MSTNGIAAIGAGAFADTVCVSYIYGTGTWIVFLFRFSLRFYNKHWPWTCRAVPRIWIILAKSCHKPIVNTPPPLFFKFIFIWAFIYEAPAGEWYGRAAGPSDLCGALAAPDRGFPVDHITGCVNLKCWNHNLLQSNMAVLMSCSVDLDSL